MQCRGTTRTTHTINPIWLEYWQDWLGHRFEYQSCPIVGSSCYVGEIERETTNTAGMLVIESNCHVCLGEDRRERVRHLFPAWFV